MTACWALGACWGLGVCRGFGGAGRSELSEVSELSELLGDFGVFEDAEVFEDVGVFDRLGFLRLGARPSGVGSSLAIAFVKATAMMASTSPNASRYNPDTSGPPLAMARIASATIKPTIRRTATILPISVARHAAGTDIHFGPLRTVATNATSTVTRITTPTTSEAPSTAEAGCSVRDHLDHASAPNKQSTSTNAAAE